MESVLLALYHFVSPVKVSVAALSVIRLQGINLMLPANCASAAQLDNNLTHPLDFVNFVILHP